MIDSTLRAQTRPLFSRTPEPILQPVPGSPWASGAVFNPGAWYDGETVHLLVRGIPIGYQRRHAEEESFTGFDEYVSHIGYASSADGVHFSLRESPFISPDAPFDVFGAEDPRISRIDDTYLITYTALSAPAFGSVDGVRIGLASTIDFETVDKHGVIGPPIRDKDAVIFPRLIDGRIAMLHRIEPNIQLVYFDDLETLCHPGEKFWQAYLKDLERHTVMKPNEVWEEKKIGAGPTPIETPDGWLLIYHGVDKNQVYRAGIALLDLYDPARVLARSRVPVLEPETEFEVLGDVDHVVFPEGAVVIDGTLHLYYGAADRVICHATAKLEDVLSCLLSETTSSS
ncbi:MAG: glycosidase [Bacteroidetes bacterium]|nr:glycosidase [Bacteroidota bacterium]